MQIGEKIKALRGNMTQAELSRRAKVDKAIISKIESGKMSGTIECHKRLAEAFGLKLSELYAYFEELKPEPAEFYSGENGKKDTYQDFLEIITHLPLSKKMLPTFMTLEPGEEKFLEETAKKAERFILTLTGEIEVEVEGKVYQLKRGENTPKGDCLYSASALRHRIKNIGKATAVALCVSSPPVL
jgi:putative transcriptional regulator